MIVDTKEHKNTISTLGIIGNNFMVFDVDKNIKFWPINEIINKDQKLKNQENIV